MALPILLGSTAAVTTWLILQTLIIATALGDAGTGVTATADRFAVASTIGTAAALGVGAALAARLLAWTRVAPRAARQVAHAQSAGLAGCGALLGLIASGPRPELLALLVTATAVASLLGARVGAPYRRRTP